LSFLFLSKCFLIETVFLIKWYRSSGISGASAENKYQNTFHHQLKSEEQIKEFRHRRSEAPEKKKGEDQKKDYLVKFLNQSL